MPQINVATWERAWAEVARRQFEDFARADTKSAAVEVWNRQRVLDDARKLLADAFADGDLELMAKLDPINPYKVGSNGGTRSTTTGA